MTERFDTKEERKPQKLLPKTLLGKLGDNGRYRLAKGKKGPRLLFYEIEYSMSA